MALSAKASDYDHTIHDINGIVGVKDGVKYPINKEDWNRENPHKEHRDSECRECSFVNDVETLFAFLVSREQKQQATSKPLFVGKFTMPGWSGHSGFYLFKCLECGDVNVDYPHGYCDFGCLFLSCKMCRERLVLDPRKEGTVYKAEGVPIPLPSRKEREVELLKVVRKAQQESGVKVFINGKQVQNESSLFSRYKSFLQEYFNF